MVARLATLKKALTLIPTTQVSFLRCIGVIDNEIGFGVASYAPGVLINNAIMQPVKTSVYHKLGLDMQKNYMNIFIEKKAFAINFLKSPDRFKYLTKTWQVISTEDWFDYDYYIHALVVEVKNDKI